ncbi:hypothetical protein CDAR_99021 [Caerostris darwini]|uniref:Uncharacterized protein n=1 Tax=Caerostris darwini TaxID=1538125 RepID=A0AAV4Q4D3_9ARAC|nr:hypothetical protein CDAR_99021 [Caerostris darwini]
MASRVLKGKKLNEKASLVDPEGKFAGIGWRGKGNCIPYPLPFPFTLEPGRDLCGIKPNATLREGGVVAWRGKYERGFDVLSLLNTTFLFIVMMALG